MATMTYRMTRLSRLARQSANPPAEMRALVECPEYQADGMATVPSIVAALTLNGTEVARFIEPGKRWTKGAVWTEEQEAALRAMLDMWCDEVAAEHDGAALGMTIRERTA